MPASGASCPVSRFDYILYGVSLSGLPSNLKVFPFLCSSLSLFPSFLHVHSSLCPVYSLLPESFQPLGGSSLCACHGHYSTGSAPMSSGPAGATEAPASPVHSLDLQCPRRVSHIAIPSLPHMSIPGLPILCMVLLPFSHCSCRY